MQVLVTCKIHTENKQGLANQSQCHVLLTRAAISLLAHLAMQAKASWLLEESHSFEYGGCVSF